MPNPDCIIWLTSNNTMHPHAVNSDMYKEADWLMNEAGDIKRALSVKPMIGKHTRLITCLARWNGQDATKVVPEALEAGVGLYGFTKPRQHGSGLVPLEGILSRPVSELRGDDRNIAVLARAFNAVSVDATWDGNTFGEPIEKQSDRSIWRISRKRNSDEQEENHVCPSPPLPPCRLRNCRKRAGGRL